MSKQWYGDITSRLEENHQFVKEIKVGDGVTEYLWSDRHPYEIIAVKDQKHFTMRALDHKADESKDLGMGHQHWILESNENNPAVEINKRGKYWYEVYQNGEHKKYTRINISIGKAEYYYDWSF